MNRREKILAGVIFALVGLWIAKTGYDKAVTHYDQRSAMLDSLERQVRKGKSKSRHGQRAEQRQREWRKISLTSDRREARAQYQQWLRHCATESRIDDAEVDSSPRVTRRKGYEELTFTFRGVATLDQATHFLHEFYGADYLHKIRRLHLAPKAGSKTKYDLSVTILALIVEGAEKRDRSTPEKSARPQYGDLASYQKMIGERALFSEYVPPRPSPPPKVVETRPRPSPPKPPSFDEAKHTVVTAITSKSGVWVVWFRTRTTGKTLKLAVGETLEIGSMNARVIDIYRRQVLLATENERLLLDLGESLSEALVLPEVGS